VSDAEQLTESYGPVLVFVLDTDNKKYDEKRWRETSVVLPYCHSSAATCLLANKFKGLGVEGRWFTETVDVAAIPPSAFYCPERVIWHKVISELPFIKVIIPSHKHMIDLKSSLATSKLGK
jgi:hypothetical protein